MNILTAERLHTLRKNLVEHFNIDDSDSSTYISASVTDNRIKKRNITVSYNKYLKSQGGSLLKSLRVTFDTSWTAENWQDFEQLCKDSL